MSPEIASKKKKAPKPKVKKQGTPDPDTARLMKGIREEEFKNALWLFKDFKEFNSNRFSQKVQVQISDEEFSIVEDALEGYLWWAGERLGYSTDKMGRLIHGARAWKRLRRKG